MGVPEIFFGVLEILEGVLEIFYRCPADILSLSWRYLMYVMEKFNGCNGYI